MKSQKQNNHSPRPFKNQFSDRGRSGGNNMGFIPGGKPAVKVAKKKPVTDASVKTGTANGDALDNVQQSSLSE